ncbi:fungal-specific transcription factor domain-containing protein [Nemania abortiva]|nr:fungal-specific transcription factor domain-containing protein [Nemania abortiva]
MSSKSTTRSRHGCWTCKGEELCLFWKIFFDYALNYALPGRKVQCDQGTPTCRKCAQAGRECEGYGLRLSWPRDNDKRRAMKASVPTTGAQIQTQMSLMGCEPFVNATSQDIRLFQYLTSPGTPKSPKLGAPTLKIWRQPYSEVPHMELIHYFRETAHTSLATFSPTTTYIRDVIMHMMFTHDTVSRRALSYAMLAYSSLHRSGLHRQTMLFKVTALEALSASANEATQGSAEAAQHVAACMILCAFEILLPSESSGEWLWYIRGALEVVQSTRLGDESDTSSNIDLVNWVYYHNSMSRFTLSHWRHKYLDVENTPTSCNLVSQFNQCARPAEERPPPPFLSPAHGILNVLSEICEVLLDPSDPRSGDIAYRDRLRGLEWMVDNIPSFTPLSDSTKLDKSTEDIEFTVQLYQIATRVYLARASQNPLEPCVNLDALIDEAFRGPIQDCYCRHFFPLLILACEARGEEQRAAILNLIDRTERKGYMRSMETFRKQVESFWIQYDLHADDDLILNYLSVMKTIISSNPALPSYA